MSWCARLHVAAPLTPLSSYAGEVTLWFGQFLLAAGVLRGASAAGFGPWSVGLAASSPVLDAAALPSSTACLPSATDDDPAAGAAAAPAVLARVVRPPAVVERVVRAAGTRRAAGCCREEAA